MTHEEQIRQVVQEHGEVDLHTAHQATGLGSEELIPILGRMSDLERVDRIGPGIGPGFAHTVWLPYRNVMA